MVFKEKIFIPIERLKELLKIFKNRGVKCIEISGCGEPTIHPNFKEFLDELKGYNFRLALVTNGSRLFKYKNSFKKIKFDWIRVSINAITNKTYNRLHGLKISKELDTEGITLIRLSKYTKSNYYKYIVLLDKSIDKKEFKKILMEKFDQGLSGGVYDIPCHMQPIFDGKFLGDTFPLAEDTCNRHICLPMTAVMKIENAKYVVDSIKSTLQFFLKE